MNYVMITSSSSNDATWLDSCRCSTATVTACVGRSSPYVSMVSFQYYLIMGDPMLTLGGQVVVMASDPGFGTEVYIFALQAPMGHRILGCFYIQMGIRS